MRPRSSVDVQNVLRFLICRYDLSIRVRPLITTTIHAANVGTFGGTHGTRNQSTQQVFLVVSRASEPGYYLDGAGLYLQVSPSGTKSWIYRYSIGGRSREMGLGSIAALSLSDARARAKECRHQRAMRIDPLEARRASTERRKLEDAKAITFADAAAKYIAAHEAEALALREAPQFSWRSSLETYAYPADGATISRRDRHDFSAQGPRADVANEDRDRHSRPRSN